MKTKVEIDNRKLLAQMKRLEEVTGNTVSSTLKRGARLLAVNMAFNTPPYGKTKNDKETMNGDGSTSVDISSLHLGERAILRDLMRLFYVMTEGRIRSIIDFQGREATMKYGHKGASALGDVKEKVLYSSEMKAWHMTRRTANGRVSKTRRGVTTGHRIMDLRNLDKGIVTKDQFDQYYKQRIQYVGLSKAAWASCIAKMDLSGTGLKNIWSGVPAWVKRHISKVPSSVVDKSTDMFPVITITNRLPWAHQVMSTSDIDEAKRITKQKFFSAMNKEIKATLKKQQAA